jgi:uncharacterized protein (TIGR00304 family)
MRWKWPAVSLIALGVALIIASVITGESKIAIVVIIPVVYGGGILLLCGVLAIMAGIMLLFFSGSSGGAENDVEDGTGEAEDQTHSRARAGGVLLIGPVPIIFGSDKNMALVAAAIALIAMALIIMMLL